MDDGLAFSTYKRRSNEEALIADAIRIWASRVGAHTFLDVGSGTGGILKYLRLWAPALQITAIENSPAKAAVLRKSGSASTVCVSDAEHMVLRRDYDLVSFSHVTGHFDRRARPDILARYWARARLGIVVVSNVLTGPFSAIQKRIWEVTGDFSYQENFSEMFSFLDSSAAIATTRFSAVYQSSDITGLYQILDVFAAQPLPRKQDAKLLEHLGRLRRGACYEMNVPQICFVLLKKDIKHRISEARCCSRRLHYILASHGRLWKHFR